MPPEQIIIGSSTALLCLAGLFNQAWLLESTQKGQRLTRRFGATPALWILRLFLIGGVVFGGLLATGVINPILYPAPASSE